MHRNLPFRILPLLILLAACAKSVPPPRSTPGAPAPSAAVEAFLQLAEAKNYTEMGWMFGTSEGSILRRDPPAEVEKRMYALATVLRHDRAKVQEQAPVPGRGANAVRMTVELVDGPRVYHVPFTTVRGPEDRWFVEQIGVEAITDTEGKR